MAATAAAAAAAELALVGQQFNNVLYCNTSVSVEYLS
jgi:hypothetical protein